MQFRIADTFTASLGRLPNEQQRAAKTAAFDLQTNPSQPGLGVHKLMRLPGVQPFQDVLGDAPAVLHRDAPVDGHVAPAPELLRRYRRLSLRDVFLGYAGYRDPEHSVHQVIAALNPGDPLQVRMGTDRWAILADNGAAVGQLAHNFTAPTGAGRVRAAVMAVVSWDAERSEPDYRQNLRSDAWEVVVPEPVFEPKR